MTPRYKMVKNNEMVFIIWSVKPIHRLRGWDVSDTPLRLHFEMLNNILTIQ